MELMFNNQEEVDFLLSHLKPESHVLEWGSGGSTVEIAKRVERLVSIEHLQGWHDIVSSELKKINSTCHVEYLFVPPNMEEAPGMDGDIHEYTDYVHTPEWVRFNDNFSAPTYDVIFIDGRARVECARKAIEFLRPGGVILIHDCFHPNPKYHRTEYDQVKNFLNHTGGAFTLQAFTPKYDNLTPINIEKAMEDLQPASPDAKTMCWYRDDCGADMNKFYDIHLKDQDINEHMKGFTSLLQLVEPKGTPLIDLGTGTAMISEFCKDFQFVGADLPHILKECAMRNYPEYMYRACDILVDDLEWISKFPVVVANGLIDIMPNAMDVLVKIMEHTSDYLLIHRQEITEEGNTTQIINGSYTGQTFHSIFSRADFNNTVERMNFRIVKEVALSFGNWEGGGSSFLLKRKRSYSLYNIDHKLHSKYFSGITGGRFIEAGANDGISQSNTLFLEENNDWTGILIEPVPEVLNRCRNNRSSRNIFINAALVADNYGKDKITICHIPANGGLMSVVKDGHEQKQFDRLNNTAEKIVELEVPARTLNNILEIVCDQSSIIHLMVLDVEGYEKNVLRGIDFSKWFVRYLLIEQREGTGLDVLDTISSHYRFVEMLSPQDYLYERKENI
jgi:FkbM family methyltransferase